MTSLDVYRLPPHSRPQASPGRPHRPFPGMGRFGTSTWFWYYLWKRRYHVSLRHSPVHAINDQLSGAAAAERARSYIANLDPVPPEIIAAIKAKRLFDAAPRVFKDTLRLILDESMEGSIKRADVKMNTPDEEAKIIARKGLPNDTVHGPAAALLAHLTVDPPVGKSLFVRDKSLVARMLDKKSQIPVVYSNCFVVDKSSINEATNEPFKRIIIDARGINAKLQNIAIMILFALELLIERVAHAFSVSTTATITCCSADLRHWFHQLPLPAQFRPFFALRLSHGHGKPDIVFPRSWPMGSNNSCGIGQACTWSILLADLEQPLAPEEPQTRAMRLAARKTLDIAESQRWDEIPSWLPLEHGGAVFVLIDNIFVISPRAEVAMAWRSRIVDSANRFNAKLKHIVPKGEKDDGYARQNTCQDVQVVTLRFGDPSTTIDFAGITFSGAGRRVAKPPTGPNPVTSGGLWRPTHTDLASLMGQLLWCERVHGTPMLELQEFIEIYQYATPPADSGWGRITQVPAPSQRALSELYDRRSGKNAEQYSPYPRVIEINDADVYLGASDAEGGELKGVGFVYKKLTHSQGEWTVVDRSQVESHGADRIAIGELQALLSLVETILAHDGRENAPKLIMVAVDNMSVIGMVRRAYSESPQARPWLKKLFELLKKNASKLFVSYIASAKNPADAPSRGRPIAQPLLDEIEASFRALEPVARRALLLSGRDRVVRREREENVSN